MNDNEYKILKALWKNNSSLTIENLKERFGNCENILRKLEEENIVFSLKDSFIITDLGEMLFEMERKERRE